MSIIKMNNFWNIDNSSTIDAIFFGMEVPVLETKELHDDMHRFAETQNEKITQNLIF